MKHRSRKRFGQHFLEDRRIIERIVAAIHPQKDQHLIEIGPGKGALTSVLLDRCDHLDTIELDRDLVALLRSRFAQSDRLTVHNADALSFDFSKLHSDGRSVRLIGNLPYNISTPLLFHLLAYHGFIADMHFMLQKEVVDRLCAVPGGKKYGRLSVMIQYRCRVEALFDVSPDCFNPQPKVMSAIVRISPYGNPPVKVQDVHMLDQVVAQAFSARRKTVRNSLKPFFSETELRALSIDPVARAETLSLQAFARLSNYKSAQGASTQGC